MIYFHHLFSSQMTITPFSRPISIQDYSSEGESEQE